MSKKVYKLATWDIETDPFLYGREPKPFCCGFYTDGEYVDWWPDDSTQTLALFIAWLKNQKKRYRIYAHNGGKFDFVYLLKAGYLEGNPKIINGRIVQANIGKHEIRDSYAILPISLAEYRKDDFNYKLLEYELRDLYREEILKYLKNDCKYLYDLVSKFVTNYGYNLTIGTTAMKELIKLYPFEKRNRTYDEKFRKFYAGGRVECLTKQPVTKKKAIKVYDVNSMYPYVMKEYNHPSGDNVILSDKKSIDKFLASKDSQRLFFMMRCNAVCNNKYGLFPVREKTGLAFYGNIEEPTEIFLCSHEYNAIKKLNLDMKLTIHELTYFKDTIKFPRFVKHFNKIKIASKNKGYDFRTDEWVKYEYKIDYIIAKLLLNSCYGKFGQNPDNFYEYKIVGGNDPKPDDYELYQDFGNVEVWRVSAFKELYYDVAVAASICSAARAELLIGIYSAKEPFYCDTDGLICVNLPLEIDGSKLGAWKIEATGKELYLGAKKMYALFDKKGNCVKHASRGVRLSPAEIKQVAIGDTIIYERDAPSMSIAGGQEMKFIKRKVRSRL